MVNILDDFFFPGIIQTHCDLHFKSIMDLNKYLDIPIYGETMFDADQSMSYVWAQFDTIAMTTALPVDKLLQYSQNNQPHITK